MSIKDRIITPRFHMKGKARFLLLAACINRGDIKNDFLKIKRFIFSVRR